MSVRLPALLAALLLAQILCARAFTYTHTWGRKRAESSELLTPEAAADSIPAAEVYDQSEGSKVTKEDFKMAVRTLFRVLGDYLQKRTNQN
ncbi:PREDICTED: uncharacterized protein LOC109485239 [Branchiostoma belcheri]|uniref:Uncharacterized protein LOC109485239 n=2 Tax=Branchiostoma belcheri TaxID=7741 RepID=A0A6P4ZSS8_BRABE|nr:PREDICTED: uncharacterized protein LOC109485239 [Branchiostoma belcheri]